MDARRRVMALGLFAAVLCRGQDARSIVVRSLHAFEVNESLRRDYVYEVRNETHELDSKGNLKSVHSTVDEVFYMAGKRYLHPLRKDDKPLSADEARKERIKLDRAAVEAGRLTADERARRIEEEERARVKQREPLFEVPDAFDFPLLGEEAIGGRPAWKIGATPRADYDGRGKALLRNVEGSLWIDKADGQCVRIEANALNSFWVGLFLAHIDKGTHMTFEATETKDLVWVPRRITLSASARLLLLRKLNASQDVTFSNYRKFRTDSRIVSSEPP
jgi:hypothetical protein